MNVVDELYRWVTMNGHLSPEEALKSLRDWRKVEADLRTTYGPYGDNWNYDPNMPALEESLELLLTVVKQRLIQETSG